MIRSDRMRKTRGLICGFMFGGLLLRLDNMAWLIFTSFPLLGNDDLKQ